MKFGSVQDYLAVTKGCGKVYEAKTLDLLRSHGQLRLAEDLEQAFSKRREAEMAKLMKPRSVE